MKNKGLAFKLIVFILMGTTGTFLAAFAYYHMESRQSVMKEAVENARNLARATVHEIETVLVGVEKVPRNFSMLLQELPHEGSDVWQLVRTMVEGNDEIFGTAVAFEPHAFDPESPYFAAYCYRDPAGNLAVTSLGGTAYHYFTMDWYQIPKEMNRPVWTEPYFDEGGGNVVMATFSVPFYGKENELRGVVTADISLAWLEEIVRAIRVYDTGYAFLISRNGMFVTHPDTGMIMRESVFSLAEERGLEELRRVGRQMIAGGEGLTVLHEGVLSDSKSWMYHAPLTSTGWSLGIVIPDDELFADVRRLGREVVLIAAFGLLLLGAIVAFISQRITRPLRSLAQTTVEISQGNLDAELPPIGSEDEIGRLARSFGNMRVALKEYITNLAETTAAKERIESELKIAATIQRSFLPKKFPLLAREKALEIFADLHPAREIGGDLYDFFLLDEKHLFFAVGDVSGKGIPAALFMAVTKTLLKGIAETGMDPSDILSRTNLELCRDNDSMMFVTVFCGILDMDTGSLRYSSAGHDPPIIIRHGGAPEWMDVPGGFVLGAMEESEYETREILLNGGDTLFVYTDGVTEAMNEAQELYSQERLMDAVRSGSSLRASALGEAVLDSVRRFSGQAPQSDDVTVFALTLRGHSS